MRLKWLVVLTVVGIQLMAAALVVATTWQGVSDGVGDAVRTSMNRLGTAARDRFQGFVEPAADTAVLVRRLIAAGALEWADAERLERLLFEILRLHPAFDAIYVDRADGEYLYMQREAGRPDFLIREARRIDGQEHASVRRRGADFAVEAGGDPPGADPGPELRPRLVTGEDAGAASSGSRLKFVPGPSGVTIASALADGCCDGKGAVAVEIEFTSVSALLSDLSGGGATTFIVDRDGQVLVQPSRTDSPVLDRDRLRSLVAAAALSGRQFGEIGADRGRYLVDVQAFREISIPWYIAVAIPVGSLHAWVYVLGDRVVAVTSAMAVLAVLMALVAWRFGVERPVAAVAARLHRIAVGAVDGLPVLSGPAEFRELDAAVEEAGRRIADREGANLRLVDTLREYEDAVEQSPGGIAIIDPDGRVVFANETYRRLIGPADPVGDAPRLFAIGNGTTAAAARLRAVLDGRTVREDVSGHRADDGAPVVLQCALAPLLSDRAVGSGRAILLVEDVTARKRIEQDLVAARNVAERSDRAKSAFLGQMSHELRTPLNAIIGFSEIMRTEMFGPLGSRRYVEYADHIETSARHLKELIDQVLDLSRVERGDLRVSFRDIAPEEPVRQATDMVGPAASNARVRLELEVDRTVLPQRIRADPAAIRQIVVNLISNAVKFSPPGTTITTTLRGTEDGGVAIEVADQGIGIEPRDLPHVFEPFYQGSAAWDAGRVGVGLGLAIVRALVDLHGGDIEIDSAKGIGTRVRTTLPADPRTALGTDPT